VVAFFIFSFIPLFQTLHYSWYTYYKDQLDYIGPTWVGFENYVISLPAVYSSDLLFLRDQFGNGYDFRFGYYTLNTLVIWVMGFIPQIIVSLLLGRSFHRRAVKAPFSRILQNRLLYAEPHHGGRLWYVVPNDLRPDGTGFECPIELRLDQRARLKSVLRRRRPGSSSPSLDFVMWFGNTTCSSWRA
jgi:hypothetical protein